MLLSWSFCRTCLTCAEGHPAHCDSWPLLNLTGNRACGTPAFSTTSNEPIKSSFLGQSSFARHLVADESSVILVPAETSKEDLEIMSVLGCGMITGAGAVLNILRPKQGVSCSPSSFPLFPRAAESLLRRLHHRGIWNRSSGSSSHHGSGHLSPLEDHRH